MEPDLEYIDVSVKILNGIIKKYGSMKKYFNMVGGRKLS